MSKSVFKLVFSNGSTSTVHCSRVDLDSTVLHYLDCCSTLDPRITYCRVYQVVGVNRFRFVSKFELV